MQNTDVIKKAIIEHNGVIHYKSDMTPCRHSTFGILKLKDERKMVLLPERPNYRGGELERVPYKGMLWEIELIDGVPTVSGKHYHFFNYTACNIETAVKAFNYYYKYSKYEPGEIVKLLIIEDKKEEQDQVV